VSSTASPLLPTTVRIAKSPVVDAARFLVSARLVDSLLHEARNPLNALSINLGILGQKLRVQASPDVPPPHEKNLKAMREQLTRVDEILRLFAEFIAPKPATVTEVDFSEVVRRAVEVLGHEGRQHRCAIRAEITPGLKLQPRGTGLEFLALLPLMRAITRAQGGGEAALSLTRSDRHVILAVQDNGAEQAEPMPESLPALEVLSHELGGSLHLQGGELKLQLPSR
jgi:signal transduction histidine kinase